MNAVLNVLEAPARRGVAAPGAAESEFNFGTADFERVRRLIFQRAGIRLGPGKQALVYSRLSRRLRETGQRSFSAYLLRLESATTLAAEPEWHEFVGCLTTDTSAFLPLLTPVTSQGPSTEFGEPTPKPSTAAPDASLSVRPLAVSA